MPGPPPNPNRRRRNVGPQLLELPSEGRKGAAPRWPLAAPPAPVEKRIWSDLWHLPQAVMWDRFGYTRVVARYVRTLAAAEETLARDVMSEARQLEDKLGLTPKAMKDLMWKVADDELDEARRDHPAAAGARRLKAVDPSAVAGT